MSTRCQVILKKEGKPVHNFYRHCDGYPSEMLPWIDNNIGAMVAFDNSGLELDYESAFDADNFFCCGVRYYGVNENVQSDLDFIYIVDITTEDYKLTVLDAEHGDYEFDLTDGGKDMYISIGLYNMSITNKVLTDWR